MYTLVLMSALGTAPDSTQFNGFFRDLFGFRGGCNGCRGDDVSTSRDTSGCSGCSGGGLFHGRIINWFSGCHGSCHGSCTGCSGGSGRAVSPTRSTACSGGCNGSLADRRTMPTGCNGFSPYAAAPSYGSCTGSGYGSCFGSGLGSCFGSTGAIPWNGTPGGFGGYDTIPGMGGGTIIPGPGEYATPRPIESSFGQPIIGDGFSYPVGVPTIVPPPGGIDSFSMPMTMPAPKVGEERGSLNNYRPAVTSGSSPAQRGTVIVKLPADAKLYAEGRPLSQTAGERKFVTPPLPADREAVYTFRVEYTRDGRTVSESQKIQVKAGGTATVEFADLTAARQPGKPAELYATGSGSKPSGLPTIVPPSVFPSDGKGEAKTDPQPLLPPVAVKPAVAQDRAKIVVKLPPGAVLFVDGRRNERTDSTREFTTPTLQAGKEYSYVMKAEWRRNGQPESQEQKIEFRAGEQLTVDFTTNTQRASR